MTRFELAIGGALFLDELGELPLNAQIALRRLRQEKKFERVEGKALIKLLAKETYPWSSICQN